MKQKDKCKKINKVYPKSNNPTFLIDRKKAAKISLQKGFPRTNRLKIRKHPPRDKLNQQIRYNPNKSRQISKTTKIRTMMMTTMIKTIKTNLIRKKRIKFLLKSIQKISITNRLHKLTSTERISKPKKKKNLFISNKIHPKRKHRRIKMLLKN